MMVMSIMRIEGDPDDLRERMTDLEKVVERIAPEMGGISSTVVRTDDGLMIVNLWKDEQARHKMAEHPEVQAAVRAAGLPAPHAEGYEVLAHRTADQTANA
jgi:quinol monooxygenase YgiN